VKIKNNVFLAWQFLLQFSPSYRKDVALLSAHR